MTALPAPAGREAAGAGRAGGSPGPGVGAALSRAQGRLRPVSAGKIGISSNAPGSALRRDSMVTGKQIAGKPRRNDEPPRDAGRTGSAGSHRPARRRYHRRVQLRPGPADQREEHPGAFLTQGNQRPVPGRIWMSSPAPARTSRPPETRARPAGAGFCEGSPTLDGHLVLYSCADGPAGPASLEWAGQLALRAAAGLLAGRNRRILRQLCAWLAGVQRSSGLGKGPCGTRQPPRG
jgi:hypothetical protein